MSRLLFWLGLAFLVTFAIRTKIRELQQRGRPPQAPPARPPRPAAGEAETMLCCAHCGMYFPASEVVRRDGRDFCGPAHAAPPAAR